jgi:putative endonuclease
LYTGVTRYIYNRTLDHKEGMVEGFTRRYNINRLVYFETFQYVNNAIAREKQIKAWTRAKRIALIKSTNPTWLDLAEGWGKKAEMQIPRSARDDNGSSRFEAPQAGSSRNSYLSRNLREKEQ